MTTPEELAEDDVDSEFEESCPGVPAVGLVGLDEG